MDFDYRSRNLEHLPANRNETARVTNPFHHSVTHRESDYDLIVIGAGAAGSIVASDAVGQGARVALIEQWAVGGTCLNAGCDPTKTLVKSAEVLHSMRHADRYGLNPGEPEVQWSRVMERVAGVIDTIRGGDGDQNIRDKGIDLFKSSGRFVNEHQIEVDGQLLTADRFVIAAGARQFVPDIDGIRDVGFIDTFDAVNLPELPKSMAIVGGGPVAVEFAQIFARFGVEVTLLGSREQILPKEEPELAVALADVLRAEGIRVETGVRVTSVRFQAGRKLVHGEQEHHAVPIMVVVDEILLATGRRPAVHELGLGAAGVEFSDRGVVVDGALRTSVSHIWACGDVTGIYPFTHVADYQARIVSHNLFTGGPYRKADYRVIPWATFTAPELARVGLTEAEAKAGGYSVITSTIPMKDQSRAIVSNAREGMVKLVVDRVSRQILGGHILAEHGGELIGEVALAMRHGLTVDAIAETVHVYPTMSEAVFSAASEIVGNL
jgi:pyruvate/2-oxoglutarate dehydrogenase complex dihydrolipoamide dehydrogenase (E3) component